MTVSKSSLPSQSKVNRLSLGDRLQCWWQTNTGRVPQHYPSVQWVSYHIPKTAGTSLRTALVKAYGTDAVFGAYRQSGSRALSQGKAIWLPNKTRVVHGHVKTHARHAEIFPNARRIVWVRDPIQRAWSLLTRLLEVKEKDPFYPLFKARYLDKGITDKEALFECFVKDNDMNRAIYGYRMYFKAIPPSEFDFVGSVHSMHEDMERLSACLGVDLGMQSRNKRTGGKDMPDSLYALKPLFEKEYRLVEPYLRLR